MKTLIACLLLSQFAMAQTLSDHMKTMRTELRAVIAKSNAGQVLETIPHSITLRQTSASARTILPETVTTFPENSTDRLIGQLQYEKLMLQLEAETVGLHHAAIVNDRQGLTNSLSRIEAIMKEGHQLFR